MGSVLYGLYQIKQFNPQKGLDHYAVLDSGDILRQGITDGFARIYDLSPNGIESNEYFR